MSERLNCIIVDDDPISIKITEQLVEQTGALDLVGKYDSALKAFDVIRNGGIDVIFLDIEMPEMSGIQLLDSLDTKPQVVLVTSKEEYALNAFDLEVTDYLLKPISAPRFLKALNKIRNKHKDLPADTEKDSIFIKVDSNLVNFPFKKIHYIEAFGDYIKIHTPEKVYTVYSTMKSIESRLPTSEFMRIHRSYLIRLDSIEHIGLSEVVILNKNIPVSNTYKQNLMNRINTL